MTGDIIADCDVMKLSQMTEAEARRYYEYHLLKSVKMTIPKPHPEEPTGHHDFWSVYDYGEQVKVVYIKAAPKPPKSTPLFAEDSAAEKPPVEKHSRKNEGRFETAVARAKARIFELAMCNEFTHFCTFTQDKKMRDRFDLKTFRKDLAQLIRNINRSRPENQKIKYLLIPEKHKDGAWHMHGLMMNLTGEDLRAFTLEEKLPQRIRSQIEKGVGVYDFKRYRQAFGFFTCTEIANHTAVSKYVTKYISKDLSAKTRESGEHLFFASQGLKGKETILKRCFDKCPVDTWDYENDYVKIAYFNVPKMVHNDLEK